MGQFNPLWSLLLAREHGSIVKRFRDAVIGCGSYYHVENLNPEYKMDLKGFTESNKMKGVYYENMTERSRDLRLEEIPIQKSALSVIADKTKKPLIEGDDKLETFEFSNDEDDEVFQWDFPNFQFVKEVVPRITQASLVTDDDSLDFLIFTATPVVKIKLLKGSTVEQRKADILGFLPIPLLVGPTVETGTARPERKENLSE
ncbi:hypothetical protein Daesc_003857 [Daldinia eschscholtzii]|uniref:Uncharacterized protein n=1 Tax=Daldinia eschscholtzii TaxID=292717 RepID=A0AAX6MMM4_9PEZI